MFIMLSIPCNSTNEYGNEAHAICGANRPRGGVKTVNFYKEESQNCFLQNKSQFPQIAKSGDFFFNCPCFEHKIKIENQFKK